MPKLEFDIPVNIGDEVFMVKPKADKESKELIVYTSVIRKIEITKDKNDLNNYVIKICSSSSKFELSQFGKSVFNTREEAENAIPTIYEKYYRR